MIGLGKLLFVLLSLLFLNKIVLVTKLKGVLHHNRSEHDVYKSICESLWRHPSQGNFPSLFLVF